MADAEQRKADPKARAVRVERGNIVNLLSWTGSQSLNLYNKVMSVTKGDSVDIHASRMWSCSMGDDVDDSRNGKQVKLAQEQANTG